MAIAIQDLEKHYQRRWNAAPVVALGGLTLSVESGEAFGFIGANGAGKTTTIKILMGLIQASSGKAQIFGISVALPAARLGLGYVPENPYLYDYLTPLEILAMGMRLHRVKVNAPESHCLAWLERLGLAHVADKAIRSFSKGMTQRVAIAQALCIQPRLLILDEPLSGLDPVGRKDVVDILGEYRASGGTIFLTSHVLHDVERLADRFGLIHRGDLITVQAPGELLHDEQTVTVRSSGLNPVRGFICETHGRWRGDIRRDGLWESLNALRAAGHSVLEIRPSLTLEDVFFRHIESDPISSPANQRDVGKKI